MQLPDVLFVVGDGEYARLRPMFGRDAGQPQLFTITDGSALEYRKEEGADISRYAFDNVFGMESKQEDVYESIGAVALDLVVHTEVFQQLGDQ